KRDAELKAAAATPKTIPEADVSMKPKLKDVMKDIPDGQVVEWVLSDKDTGDKMTVRGKKQGNEFIVLESSQQPKGSTTATTMRKQTEDLKIPLSGDAQEIDLKKIVAAVKDDRTKEIKLAREAFIKDKVMALETVQKVKLEGETLTVSAEATIKPQDGATAETTSTKTKMTVIGTIDATKADAPVMVIKKDSNIQVGDNVVKAPKDISIDLKGMDIAKLKAGDADQLKELNKRLAASTDLTEVVKGNLPTASLPPQALPGMGRSAGSPSK
ncbi:MAG: hypothetical protein EBV03_07665, partial [Proteobacteria bacterium]|nr:hypothetical protein [Pseudomonadota bacterium]